MMARLLLKVESYSGNVTYKATTAEDSLELDGSYTTKSVIGVAATDKNVSIESAKTGHVFRDRIEQEAHDVRWFEAIEP